MKRKAHLVGINISKATENYLRILLGQLSNIDLSQVKLEEEVKEPKKKEPEAIMGVE